MEVMEIDVYSRVRTLDIDTCFVGVLVTFIFGKVLTDV